MQQNNKTQNELKTGTIHEYFDRNILTLTMSNPTKKNAINYEMYTALSQALDEAATNQDIHVVVLTGEDSTFTSGNDVNAFEKRDRYHHFRTTRFDCFLKKLSNVSKTDYC